MNLTTELRKGLWAVAGILAFVAVLTISAGNDGFFQPAQISGLENQLAAESTAGQGFGLTPFPDPSLLDGPHPIRMPGLIVDTGVYFEVRDSVYLDVSLRSSEEIKVYLESSPETITLSVEGVGSVDSTVLTIQGLTPGKTYYKYQGSPSNEAVFVSNEQGSHTWQHDLTGPYLVWIQERREPVFEPSKPSTSSVSALNQGLIQSTEATITIYVPDDYSTIQSAVIAASPGDTIIVSPGTYTENVNINKAYLTLESESGAAQTIIQAADSNDYVVKIIANYVTVDGFTLTGGRSGIYFGKVNNENVADYSTISNNKITDNARGILSGTAYWCDPMYGWPCYRDGAGDNLIKDNELVLIAKSIFLGYGDNHIIMGNTITGNNTGVGISFGQSSHNEVTNNTITDFSSGISLGFSGDNEFTDNTISGNVGGLYASWSSVRTFTNNTVSNNSEYGLRLEYASVKLYHNNFINNGGEVVRHIYERFLNSFPSLYEEYPTGGNYWSGHISEDNYSGPEQDQPGSDGIGETPYSVLGRFCFITCIWVTAYDNYPFLQETGWEVPTLPDLSVASVPLEFFNNEPPFLPNVLKIRAWVANNGTVTAEQPIARFFLDDVLIGTKNLDPIGPESGAEATIEWTASSNVENAVLKVEVEPVGQEDASSSDNIITQPLSFYFVDFRHDRDAFWFENWGYSTFSDARKGWFDFLQAQWEEKDIPTFIAASLPWGPLFSLALDGGHCHGMSASSLSYYLWPEIKPVNKPTFSMEEEEVKPDIIERQWEQLLLVHSLFWQVIEGELPYSASAEYGSILRNIRDSGRPILVSLGYNGKIDHSVLAYKILDIGEDEKRVYIYENNQPYDDPLDGHYLTPLKRKGSDYHVLFKPSSNQVFYTLKTYRADRAFAVEPWKIMGSEEIIAHIKQTLGSWFERLWSRGRMLFHTRSPVASLLTDEFGRRIGYIEGIFVNEIPGAEMEEQLDSFLFYLPSDLTFSIEMTGTDVGVLGLSFVIPVTESRAKVVTYEDIPITLGFKATTTLSATEIPSEVVLDTGEIITPKSTGALDASDIVPPAPVNDFTTINPRTDSITLNWTAPGDDWATGTAVTYDIRYSTLPLTEENWEIAIQVTNEPIPQLAGSEEVLTINGLDRDTTYYFALKTADEILNWSSLSNIAIGTTKIKASVDIAPDALNLKSKSKWVTGYIELPQRYNVGQIDIFTVKLNNTVSAEANPKYEFVRNPEIKDRDKNGLPELMVKFNRQEVQEILNPAEEVKITVTGRVFHNEDYKEFEGSDIIKVIAK